MLERRQFLTGLIAAVAAPAIVRASSLMPVKAIKPPAMALPDGWVAVSEGKLIRVTFKIFTADDVTAAQVAAAT